MNSHWPSYMTDTEICHEAKALYRMQLFYSPWDKTQNYSGVYYSLPINECQKNKEEFELIKKVKKCMDDYKDNRKECEPLMHEFKDKYCFTKEVDKKTKMLNRYFEGEPTKWDEWLEDN